MSDILTHGTLNTGLLASYDFEDDLTDSSGNAGDLTGIGSPTYVTSGVGKGIDLTPSDGLNVPSAATPTFGGDLSFEFWIERDVVSTPFEVFLYPVNDTADGWILVTGGSNIPAFGSRNGGTADGGNIGTVGTPYHIVGTYDHSANQSEIYVDGVKGSSGSASNYTAITTPRLNQAFGGYGMDGKLSVFRSWNKVLTQSEVTDLYNSGSGLPYDAGGGNAYDAASSLSIPSLIGSAAGTFVPLPTYDADSDLSVPSLTGSSTGTFVALPTYDADSTESLPSLTGSVTGTFLVSTSTPLPSNGYEVDFDSGLNGSGNLDVLNSAGTVVGELVLGWDGYPAPSFSGGELTFPTGSDAAAGIQFTGSIDVSRGASHLIGLGTAADSQFIFWFDSTVNSRYSGVVQDGSTASSTNTIGGSFDTFVNQVSVGTTRNGLHDDLSTATNSYDGTTVFRAAVHDVNLSAWSDAAIGNYQGGQPWRSGMVWRRMILFLSDTLPTSQEIADMNTRLDEQEGIGGNAYDAASSLSIPSLIGSITGTFVALPTYDADSDLSIPSLTGSITGTSLGPTPIGTITTPTGGVFETDELIACSVDVVNGPATGVEMQINRNGAGWVRWFDLTDPNVDDTWTGSLAANDTGV